MPADKSATSKAAKSKSAAAATSKRSIELPLHRKLFFAGIVVLGFFGFLEVALRAIGMGRPPIVGQLRFGYDTGIPVFDSDGIEQEGVIYRDLPLFEHDDQLFWKPIANTPFTGPLGFRKPEPSNLRSTDARALTVVVLGDSCSFLGQKPYPARLAELLYPDEPARLRVFNAGCPGYTSQQGVLRLELLDAIRPDLIIVYFGWNDHWKSLNNCTDRELVDNSLLARKAQSLLGNFHLYWTAYRWLAAAPPPAQRNKSAPLRVPLDDYAANLQSIGHRANQAGAKVLYVTAPSNFQAGNLPSWASDFFPQFYSMTPDEIAAIPTTHQQYNATSRRVAIEAASAELCDLEASFGHEQPLFRTDCIHLTEAGHEKAATEISQCVRRMFADRFE